MKRVISAGIVVFHKSKFLVLQYGAGHWSFSKGHVEKGEHLLDTARRELKEETGLVAELLPEFKHEIHYFFKQDGELISKYVYFFLGNSQSTDVTLSFEHKDFAWLPYKAALDRLTFDSDKDVLKEAERFLKDEK